MKSDSAIPDAKLDEMLTLCQPSDSDRMGLGVTVVAVEASVIRAIVNEVKAARAERELPPLARFTRE